VAAATASRLILPDSNVRRNFLIAMIETLINLLPFLLLVGLGVVLWRYRDLQRRLVNLSRIVRQAAEGDWPVRSLPENQYRIEDISNAIRSLALAQQSQLATLEDQRARLADVLDQMTDGVLIVNPEGRVALINPAAQRMFNTGTKELQGRSVTEILRHHLLVQTWQRCYDTGEAQSEAVEMPARRQFLQISVIPDRFVPGGSLIFPARPDPRPPPRNRAPRFHLQPVARTAHPAGLAQSPDRDPERGRARRPASRPPLSLTHGNRSGRPDTDDQRTARTDPHRIGTGSAGFETAHSRTIAGLRFRTDALAD
jgi:PAS domain-containing protein